MWGHDLYLRWSRTIGAMERKGWKHVIVFIYTHTSPRKLGKRRKYLGALKQNGPSDLNLSCHINNISKLSTRGCLEECGLKRLPGPKLWARLFPEEAGFLPSLKDGGPQLYPNTATTENDNTCLSNLFANVNPEGEKYMEMITWEPLKTQPLQKILLQHFSLIVPPWTNLFYAQCL